MSAAENKAIVRRCIEEVWNQGNLEATAIINTTMTVPDHPQARSYYPTSIQDIKAADPGAHRP